MQKKILTKTTFRHEDYLSGPMTVAAERAGMSKNDWLVRTVRERLEQEERNHLERTHDMIVQHELKHIRARADWNMELLMAFIRMFFGMLPEVDAQLQTRLNEIGKMRTNYLFNDVSQRIAGGKRSFIGELEDLVFKMQDWEQTTADPSKASAKKVP
jgi:hypothetical protein